MTLSHKKCGNKNPLTMDEIIYYAAALDGQYEIGTQLGRSGAGSSAYLLTDTTGKQFVLKIPNNPDETDKWLADQQKAIEKKEAYVGDYNGPIFIPKTLQVGEDFVVEELASGQEFSQKVYDKLSAKDKAKLAKDLAIFLNQSHQRTFQGNGTHLQLGKPSIQSIFDYFRPELSICEQIAFLNEQQAFEAQQSHPQVLTFGDYRSQNMLWDETKKQLSIIDFDYTNFDSVYREFTPFAAASYHSSYQFLRDVINVYNRLPKKHPIHIETETVKNNCILGIYHEFGRCGIHRGLLPKDQMRWLRPMRRTIEKAFRPIKGQPIRRKQHENT